MVQRVLRDPKPQPRFISPMECHRVAKLPEGPDWLYEIKQDGYRAIAVLDGNTVLLYSISGLDYTHEFPHIAFALKNIGGYIPGPQGIGELLIGEFRPPGRQLYFIKRLLAGLNKFNRREIYDAVQDLKAKTCPFVNLPEKTSEHQHALTSEVMRECIWTKPEQPCEVEFIERTRSRKLRHAEFRRLLQRG
jgi:ATP-dependent DNA ligase